METKNFIWTWNAGDTWYSPGIGGEIAARLWFWNNNQERLLTALQKDLNEGWKPVTEVGPAAFKLRSYERKVSNVTCLDIVFWVLTCGLLLLMQILSGTLFISHTTYEPVEFRVLLTK